MDKKYTIKDIAELAGVSKGTVDRVLHSRGKVSDKAKEQVEKILKEIDYQPNPIARNLKTNKVYKISVLMPDPKYDAYWEPAVQGIKDATKEFKPFGVSVNRFYYNPSDKDSFLGNSEEALNSRPDVLLMAPLFQKEALEILKKCQEKKVLVALFNNFINALNTENFIGQDLYQSGRVAASLVAKVLSKPATVLILHLDEEAHMKLKENGFKSYFEESTNTHLITASLQTSEKNEFQKACQNLFEEHPEVSAVFITNSKAYQFVKALGKRSKDRIIVGYDLLEENIAYLKEGEIDFLIHQKPKRQAYLGVGYLAEHFLFGKEIPSQSLLPIDIVTTENVMYYLD